MTLQFIRTNCESTSAGRALSKTDKNLKQKQLTHQRPEEGKEEEGIKKTLFFILHPKHVFSADTNFVSNEVSSFEVLMELLSGKVPFLSQY